MAYPVGSRPVNFYKAFQISLDNSPDDVFMADSVEGLAREMGIDSAVLKATVDEYNNFCSKGHDDLFAKNPKYLRPLIGPRYYAVKARSTFLSTFGGIKIDHNMEVIDTRGISIPGLYAGGNDAGGMWGDSYPVSVAPGAASAFALNSGRIAARNAVNYIGL